ncbi:unnamed protein product [Didymodactylos carnosus]|uniref:CBM1 domain-containing protein n=1 Tax=Didymodactylos carnosus TaxID=1234261 RepID=A0A814ZFE2_9BILA|nr:unnamed protein product [Didymodactylos carnosus]CAF4007184.1 unnamed protein product [Didymodactylos carnosus]
MAAVATIPIQYIALGGRCGGEKDTREPLICAIGTYCFIQNENYGECRTSCPSNWYCQKQTLPEWAPCGGETYVGLTKCKESLQCEGYGTFPCDAGLTCFRRNKFFSSCQYSCPLNVGWECETQPYVSGVIAAGWDQCGGDGWRGPSVCPAGYVCYARTVWYSQCRPVNDCPADWICTGLFPTTTPAPIITAAPLVVPAYSQCNIVNGSVCAPGTACFRTNDLVSECRPSCPPGWACEIQTVPIGEQCGGEGYVGLRTCAPGLHCYYRSKWYGQCSDKCPAADWLC